MSAFWHFVTKEWYFSSPMFVMSLVATVLVVWRILLNLNANTNMNDFLPAFQDKLEKEGVEGALRFCRTADGHHPAQALVGRSGNVEAGLGRDAPGHGQRHRAGDHARPELPAAADPGHRQDRHHGRPARHGHQHDRHLHADQQRDEGDRASPARPAPSAWPCSPPRWAW